MKSIAFIFLLVTIFTGCSRLSYDVTPDNDAVYHSLRIKVNVKNLASNQRQNFKVLLKYSEAGDKMFFLSPLNQVYGLLLVKKETALMVNTKKKKYWQGPFKELLRHMWGRDMDFHYAEFKALLVNGAVPEKKAKTRGLEILIQKIQKGGNNEFPQRLQIKSRDIRVKVKISNRKTSRGRLGLNAQIKNMRKARLRELLE
jgi:hypothetical protein